ncbi:hypothetical protein VCR4J2_580029 [Vibrio coralliirubri]|nr:hypothetical protein VCR4J2_580029 [Vibrio coralliirubri]
MPLQICSGIFGFRLVLVMYDVSNYDEFVRYGYVSLTLNTHPSRCSKLGLSK